MSSEFLAVARDLASEAGQRLTELRKTDLIKERKSDRSIVTNADHEADRIIRSGLRQHFPEHSILTEESGMDERPGAEYTWVVDPMDGTKAYVQGVEGFSVMIGLLRKGEPFAGVVMDPWRNRLFEAVRGEGTYLWDQGKRTRVNVSDRREWKDMPIVTSTGFPPPLEKKIKAKFPSPWIPAMNSVGIKVGQLVRHEADLYVNHHRVHYWDTAAPQIILEEAGGVLTYADGKELVYDLQQTSQHLFPTIATNGRRHSEFVRIIQDLL